jgi:hypothetical protein
MFMNLLLGATLALQYSHVLGSVRFLSRFAHLPHHGDSSSLPTLTLS